MQCNKCNSSWDNKAGRLLDKCPFCLEQLPVDAITIFDPNSNEGKMQVIVAQFTPEIYNDIARFHALIKDFFPCDDFGKLLCRIIYDDASTEVYKFLSITGNDLLIQYNFVLDKLHGETFIPKEILAPALNVLCAGLGLDCFDFFVPNQAPATSPTLVPVPIKVPVPAPINLNDFEIDNGVLKKYKGKGGDILIPDSVTSIVVKAFSRCSGLTSVTIPNSVISIGPLAFTGCTALTFVAIPDSVTSIGIYAFSGCFALTSVTIPNSVTSIGFSAFSRCTALTSVTIPNSVTSIGDNAFNQTPWFDCLFEKFNIFGDNVLIKYCGDDSHVSIPKSVTSIGGYTFSGCSKLTCVDIPNSVTSIGDYAFSECTALSNITIPVSINSLRCGTFKGCSALTSINIPVTFTSFDVGVFEGCCALSSIDIPASLTSINSGAFYGCDNLTDDVRKRILSFNSKAFDEPELY